MLFIGAKPFLMNVNLKIYQRNFLFFFSLLINKSENHFENLTYICMNVQNIFFCCFFKSKIQNSGAREADHGLFYRLRKKIKIK